MEGTASQGLTTDQDEIFRISSLDNLDHLDFPVCPSESGDTSAAWCFDIDYMIIFPV